VEGLEGQQGPEVLVPERVAEVQMMRPHRFSAGFSLIELMIAMTIGLILLTVLATLFDQTNSGRNALERVTRLTENSRFAADVIGDDIRHAGFYGNFMPPTNTNYLDPPPCDWDSVDVSRLGWQPNLLPAPSYPAQLQGYDDPGPAVPALGCLPDRVAGTDVLVIRRVSSAAIGGAAADLRNVYIQASQCINDPVLLRVSNTAAQFDLRTAACDVALLAPVRRYFVRVYYVASCNECSPSDGIRTLRRLEFLDGAARVVPLAEGVENFQVEYAFDTNSDGTPETLLTTTTGGTTPTAFWSNVVGVRLHMLLRSTEPGGVTSPAVYDLGPGHNAEACPANFKCRLLSTTLRLNNVAGRRED
jgi:type IV pilus assembly protein PilW